MSTSLVHISKARNCNEIKFLLACSSFNYEQNEELLPVFRVGSTATPASAPTPAPAPDQLRFRLVFLLWESESESVWSLKPVPELEPEQHCHASETLVVQVF